MTISPEGGRYIVSVNAPFYRDYLPKKFTTIGKEIGNVKETRLERDGVVEIDLLKLLQALLQKWWLIVLCALVLGAASLLYTVKFVTPLYRASITVYVNNVRSGERIDYISGSNLQASQQLVNTYSNIIQSDTVLNKVIEEAGVPYTPEQMRKILSTSQMGETELFNVYIVHPDPEEAARLANTIANVAPAEIEGFVEGSSAKIIDFAKVPDQRYSPSYSRAGLLGAVLGGLAASAYVVLRSLLDVRIRDEEDLQSLFPYPVLGQIPRFDAPASGKKNAYAAAQSAADGKGE